MSRMRTILGGSDQDAPRRLFVVPAALLASALLAVVSLAPASAAGTDPDAVDPAGPTVVQGPPLPAGLNDCAGAVTTQHFLYWGDTDEYVEVANGGFDLGLAGWTLRGKTDAVEIVPTFRGLVMQAAKGVKIVSPPICFDETRPHARMLTRLVGDPAPGKVAVEVHYRKYAGVGIEQVDVGSFNHETARRVWSPSPRMGTPLGVIRKLVRPDANGHRWFRYEFRVKGKALWQFDDLFVDPRRRN